MKLIEILSGGDRIARLQLVGQNSLVFTWSSLGRNKSLAVTATYSLISGGWHSVMLETNMVEVMLVLDRVVVAAEPETQ